MFALGSAALMGCHASSPDAPAAAASRDGKAANEPAEPSQAGAPAESAGDGRAALDTLAGVMDREGLLVKDELTAKGLADLEADVTGGLAHVAERRAQLDPDAPEHRKTTAMLNAMEAQLRAQLQDLRDGLFLTVDASFGSRQLALQQGNPSWLFVLMSPKQSRLGKVVVIFCLDERRHIGLREARRLQRLAVRENSQAQDGR